MGRKKLVKTLNVYMNGVKVGDLRKDTGGQASFQYAPDWLPTSFSISNSLPVREQEFRGEVVSRYFDNLLPDNEDIKKAMATKFGAESTRPFDILGVVGKDCVGALSFLPEGAPPPPEWELTATRLTEKKIAKKIRGLSGAAPLGMEDGEFRLSIAGAQEKTALLLLDGKWHEPLGMTPTTHILKTPIGALGEEVSFADSVDNEWASLFLCRKFGLNTCNSRIETFEDQRVLVVERFDRRWVTQKGEKVLLRLPQEDMCQALGVSPYKKYQNEGGPGCVAISNFLLGSKNGDDRLAFFRGLMVFDLLYATDGHAKNFSVFLTRSGFELTPFYDVMGGYFLHAREKRALQKMKLAMSVGDSGHYYFSKVRHRHYAEAAKKCTIGKEDFEMLCADLKSRVDNLVIADKELDADLDLDTLEIILAGIQKRVKLIL
jgi:serine/threonine-protein kinase HipA